MRVVPGSIGDAFQIHRLWLAFMADTDGDIKGRDRDLSQWIPAFSSSKFFLYLLMHGKTYVGMTWGYKPDPQEVTLRVEGIFVKRAWRGKLRAVKCLTEAISAECKKSGAVAISSRVNENQIRRVKRKGFKVSALIVEKDLRGRG